MVGLNPLVNSNLVQSLIWHGLHPSAQWLIVFHDWWRWQIYFKTEADFSGPWWAWGDGRGWAGRKNTPLLMASFSDSCESLNSSGSPLLGKQLAGNRIFGRKTWISSPCSTVSLGKFLNSPVFLITNKKKKKEINQVEETASSLPNVCSHLLPYWDQNWFWLYFPALLAAECGHVTKFWPMRGTQSGGWDFRENSAVKEENTSCSECNLNLWALQLLSRITRGPRSFLSQWLYLLDSREPAAASVALGFH